MLKVINLESSSKKILNLEKKPEAIAEGFFLVFRSEANDKLRLLPTTSPEIFKNNTREKTGGDSRMISFSFPERSEGQNDGETKDCKNFTKHSEVKLEKEKCKRIITKTDKWLSSIITEKDQYEYIKDVKKVNNLVKREIKNKISGYKSQDNNKNILEINKFIDYEFVINLLQESNLKCFYCKRDVLILYENVREPKQWSIERFFNDVGHNKDNVTIACLNCNLRRRTIYYERFVETKQLQIVKTL
jgi:hypothetical protein